MLDSIQSGICINMYAFGILFPAIQWVTKNKSTHIPQLYPGLSVSSFSSYHHKKSARKGGQIVKR